MKSSCINHPVNEPLIIIRKWQLDFCNGDKTTAALLSFFEYWHNIKLELRKRNLQLNAAAEAAGKKPIKNVTLVQYHTNDQLVEGVMGIGKRTKIIEAKEFLKSTGAISIIDNPQTAFDYDRTTHFLFHPEVVQRFIDIKEERKPTDNQYSQNSDGPAVNSERASYDSERCNTETSSRDGFNSSFNTPSTDKVNSTSNSAQAREDEIQWKKIPWVSFPEHSPNSRYSLDRITLEKLLTITAPLKTVLNEVEGAIIPKAILDTFEYDLIDYIANYDPLSEIPAYKELLHLARMDEYDRQGRMDTQTCNEHIANQVQLTEQQKINMLQRRSAAFPHDYVFEYFPPTPEQINSKKT